VPLSDALVDRLLAYAETSNSGKAPDEPFFDRKYVGHNGRSNISNQLVGLIRRATDNEGNREVVEHSLRHTFKDRGRAARVDIGVIDYLQGHKNPLSSSVSERYGTGVPPNHHKDDWERIMQTTQWGYFE
jgi:integrase